MPRIIRLAADKQTIQARVRTGVAVPQILVRRANPEDFLRELVDLIGQRRQRERLTALMMRGVAVPSDEHEVPRIPLLVAAEVLGVDDVMLLHATLPAAAEADGHG
jgi:hypothetical protein